MHRLLDVGPVEINGQTWVGVLQVGWVTERVRLERAVVCWLENVRAANMRRSVTANTYLVHVKTRVWSICGFVRDVPEIAFLGRQVERRLHAGGWELHVLLQAVEMGQTLNPDRKAWRRQTSLKSL